MPLRRMFASTSENVVKGQSFEDIESLVTTLGVISALVFTFVVELQHQTSAGITALYDFRQMLCQSQGFRDYVVDVMGWYDVGSYGFETFNFSVPTGGGKTLDIEQLLRVGIQTSFGGDDIFACVSDPMVLSATDVVFADFPTKYVKVWRANHPEMHIPSQEVEVYVAIAAAFSFSALAWSVFLYISLALSPARESKAGRESWTRSGTKALMFGWALLIAGCFTFFVGNNKFLIQQSPYPGPTNVFVTLISMLSLVIPLAAIVLAIAIYLFVMSLSAAKAEDNESQAMEQGES
jgi:preprotein translocase subunit SecG